LQLVKLTIGLTQSKYKDISERALQTLDTFIAQHPALCVRPIVTFHVGNLVPVLNDESVDGFDMAVLTLLNRLNGALTAFTNASDNNKSVTDVPDKWTDIVRKIEQAALLLMLHVPSSCDKESWSRAIFSVLSLMSHETMTAFMQNEGSPIWKSIAEMDVDFASPVKCLGSLLDANLHLEHFRSLWTQVLYYNSVVIDCA
jgi:hypothetical protein